MKVKHLFRIAFSIGYVYFQFCTININLFSVRESIVSDKFKKWYHKIMDEEV